METTDQRRRYALGLPVSVLLGGSVAMGGSYQFTLLADTSGVVGQIQTSPALSDDRQIAFHAILDDGALGIVRVSSGVETVIASTAEFSSFLGDADINETGAVGFMAQVVINATPRPGVYVGDGNTITVVGAPDPDPFGANFSFFELDATSQVLMGELAPNLVATGLAIGDGASTTHLYDGNTGFANNDAIFMGDLSDSGIVSAIAGPGVGLPWTIWQGDVAPSAPICIAGTEEFNSGFHALAANDHGDIVFIATHFDDDFRTGVYFWAGGATGCDGDTDDDYLEIAHENGAFATFDPANGPAINAAGTVVFRATLDTGEHGLYTGADPVVAKIIQTGDPLDGSTVSFVAMNRFGLNASGEIAFEVALADGRSGVYLAAPVAPCPADIDGSAAVDFGDLLAVLASWGQAGGPEDLDGSGDVGFGDLLVVLSSWGPCM